MVDQVEVRDLSGQACGAERAQGGNGWVMPAIKDPSRPCSRGTLDRMFGRAEALLATEVQPGKRWHSLRRKLATDHKDGSLKVLCELDGPGGRRIDGYNHC